MTTPLYSFVSGAIMGLALVISLFFFKFWRKSSERLFLMFALAFLLFGIERVFLFATRPSELRLEIYLLRLLAFGIIIYGVVEKNRRATLGSPTSKRI